MQEEDDLPILCEDHYNVAYGAIDSREICTCMYHGRPSDHLAFDPSPRRPVKQQTAT
jgi:hypothetical protein